MYVCDGLWVDHSQATTFVTGSHFCKIVDAQKVCAVQYYYYSLKHVNRRHNLKRN